MDFDFSLILFCIVAFCGLLWLLDLLLLKPQRDKAIADFHQAKARGKTDDEVAEAVSGLSREPLVIEYAKSFFPVLLLVFCLRSFLFEPFQIPTGSMIPTLKIGDFVLVNKFAYGVRLPIIGTKIIDVADPQRGEIMVFIPPHEDKYYIKRVIGLPGDTVRFEDKILYINGEMIAKEFIEDITVDISQGEYAGKLYKEQIGQFEHTTQTIDAARGRTRTTWIVPNGHYFMMGDNRDNSLDSREWGTVSQTDIVGKAVAVWMHKEPGLNLPTFSRSHWINELIETGQANID